MASIEYLRLAQLLKDNKKLKNKCHFTTWRGKDILIDRFQYWDNPDEYTNRCMTIESDGEHYYTCRFWEDTDEGPVNLLKLEHCRCYNITWVVHNMFMSAQHLYKGDERNIKWTIADLYRWWRDHLFNDMILMTKGD